ncbi:MAG: MBL fold metallo-hydrolase [endosymbiont of Galathealinum brachiosum]|uniref:MBL fold metallo-hydrolase n=1 Tax=endosymbiont of Galathealinum brachiosum TaxID=2200906 RepID=A0A370DHK0_9GAMM|nr:MAG: MBL fold metallo-hydrolase [endosymbiont of Galathealinum brachiosum]
MRKFNILTITFFLVLFSPLFTVSAEEAGDEFSKVEIKTIGLGHGIYMLMGMGGNIGVSVGDDGIFLIDDQFAPLTAKIKAAIAEISDKPVRFMINTHWHYDHTGGNENLGNDGVVIVAHDNVRERMSKDGFIKAFNKKVPAAPKVALPVITFNDAVTFHLNGLEIDVRHHSHAHTDGDSMVFFKNANVIHMGDTFFNGLYPFIDASSEGSVHGMIKAADLVLGIADDKTKIIPGHGPLADKKSLKVFRDMLITVRDRMQKLMDEGKTLEQIVALKPNADLDKAWGEAFLSPEVFLKVLHSSMPVH